MIPSPPSTPTFNGVPHFLLPAELLPLAEEHYDRLCASQSLAAYAQRVIGVVPALHHIVICDAIDALLDDDYDELIVLAPPGSAKSTYTSVAAAAYILGRTPTAHVLTASYSSELAEKWGRRVRNIVDSTPHQLVFPNSTLSRDSTSAGRWSTAQGGEFYAAGVGGGILGFRAKIAIIDDPISGFEEAQSLTRLQKIHGWYETDFVTRLIPTAKVILICQRLARNDLAGYLIDRNIASPTRRQRVLKLPMEATANTLDPLGRAPGDRLWPGYFTPEMVIDAKRDDFKWRTLYQQEPPADEGSWASTDDIRFRPTPPPSKGVVYYGCTDLALSVNTGDYTVHLIVAVDSNGDWDIVEADRRRVDPDSSANKVVELASTYSPLEWLIDDDNASKVFMPLVATAARASGVAVPLKLMPLRGQNKETRAASLRGQYKRRKVFMPADAHFTQWLTTELLLFPNAIGQGVDDGVDALSLMGRRLLAIARPQLVVVPKTLPTTSDMTLDDLFDDHKLLSNKRY